MEVNIYQKAIEQLVSEGYSILQIVQPSGQTLYFNIYKWQESYFNTAQSIDFNTALVLNFSFGEYEPSLSSVPCITATRSDHLFLLVIFP